MSAKEFVHISKPNRDSALCGSSDEIAVMKDIVSKTGESVEEIESQMHQLVENTANLKSISIQLENLNSNLVGPATGRMQVPVTVFLFTLAAQAIFILVLLLQNSEKEISITTAGVHIKGKGVEPQFRGSDGN